jgi:hypothetical protein
MIFFRSKSSTNTSKKVQSIRKLRKMNAKANSKKENTEKSTLVSTTMDNKGIYDVLQLYGYAKYLGSKLGGNRKTVDTHYGLRMSSDFLSWTYRSVHDQTHPPDAAVVLEWIAQIVLRHYPLLSAYADYLVGSPQFFKVATARNYVLEAVKCCTWYVLFFPGCTGLQPSSLLGLAQVQKAVCKSARKSIKLARCKDATSSMDKLVELRKMPAGGMKDLQTAVIKEMPWIESLEHTVIDKYVYNRFTDTMYAALYAFSPQGRVGGLQTMKYEQVGELLQEGFANTTEFKTAAAFTFQSVTLSDVAAYLLRLYVDRVRCAAQCADPRPDDPLFLTFAGTADLRISTKVTRFYRRTLDIHTAPTAIRSVAETAADKMFAEGKITLEERDAVKKLNGHSSQITEAFYVRRDQANMVAQARNAFACHTDHAQTHLQFRSPAHSDVPADGDVTTDTPPGPTAQPLYSQRNSTWPTTDRMCPADWGRDHPDYNSPGLRAQWTRLEIQYIGRCCDRAKAAGRTHNLTAWCLGVIHKDPAALPIFHKNHVLDNGRLAHGYKTYLNMVVNGEWVHWQE